MEILSKIMFAMTVIALIAGVFIGLGTADYSSGFNWKIFGICGLASASCLVTGMIFSWMSSMEESLSKTNDNLENIKRLLSDIVRNSEAKS